MIEKINEIFREIKSFEKPENKKILDDRTQLDEDKKKFAPTQSVIEIAERKLQINPAKPKLTPDEELKINDPNIMQKSKDLIAREEKQKVDDESIEEIKDGISGLIEEINGDFIELHKDIKDQIDEAIKDNKVMNSVRNLQDRYNSLEIEIKNSPVLKKSMTKKINALLRQTKNKSRDIARILTSK